jgi:hypothetical protein
VETWITSDGRAYFVRLLEAMSTSELSYSEFGVVDEDAEQVIFIRQIKFRQEFSTPRLRSKPLLRPQIGKGHAFTTLRPRSGSKSKDESTPKIYMAGSRHMRNPDEPLRCP